LVCCRPPWHCPCPGRACLAGANGVDLDHVNLLLAVVRDVRAGPYLEKLPALLQMT
jgi:hypothetical protein